MFVILIFSFLYLIPMGFFVYLGMHSYLSLILAFGWLLYLPFLLIPQVISSHILTSLEFPTLIRAVLEKQEENPHVLPKLFRESYHLGERSVDYFFEEETSKISSDHKIVDDDLRRYYADMLLPGIPAHVFFLGLNTYIFINLFDLITEDALILNTLRVSNILIFAIAIAPFIIFIDIPFWMGQREWKMMKLNDLNEKYSAITETIYSLSLDKAKIANDSLDSILNLNKFYYDQINDIRKTSMHPYDFEASLWIFVLGIISSLISKYIESLLIST